MSSSPRDESEPSVSDSLSTVALPPTDGAAKDGASASTFRPTPTTEDVSSDAVAGSTIQASNMVQGAPPLPPSAQDSPRRSFITLPTKFSVPTTESTFRSAQAASVPLSTTSFRDIERSPTISTHYQIPQANAQALCLLREWLQRLSSERIDPQLVAVGCPPEAWGAIRFLDAVSDGYTIPWTESYYHLDMLLEDALYIEVMNLRGHATDYTERVRTALQDQSSLRTSHPPTPSLPSTLSIRSDDSRSQGSRRPRASDNDRRQHKRPPQTTRDISSSSAEMISDSATMDASEEEIYRPVRSTKKQKPKTKRRSSQSTQRTPSVSNMEVITDIVSPRFEGQGCGYSILDGIEDDAAIHISQLQPYHSAQVPILEAVYKTNIQPSPNDTITTRKLEDLNFPRYETVRYQDMYGEIPSNALFPRHLRTLLLFQQAEPKGMSLPTNSAYANEEVYISPRSTCFPVQPVHRQQSMIRVFNAHVHRTFRYHQQQREDRLSTLPLGVPLPALRDITTWPVFGEELWARIVPVPPAPGASVSDTCKVYDRHLMALIWYVLVTYRLATWAIKHLNLPPLPVPWTITSDEAIGWYTEYIFNAGARYWHSADSLPSGTYLQKFVGEGKGQYMQGEVITAAMNMFNNDALVILDVLQEVLKPPAYLVDTSLSSRYITLANSLGEAFEYAIIFLRQILIHHIPNEMSNTNETADHSIIPWLEPIVYRIEHIAAIHRLYDIMCLQLRIPISTLYTAANRDELFHNWVGKGKRGLDEKDCLFEVSMATYNENRLLANLKNVSHQVQQHLETKDRPSDSEDEEDADSEDEYRRKVPRSPTIRGITITPALTTPSLPRGDGQSTIDQSSLSITQSTAQAQRIRLHDSKLSTVQLQNLNNNTTDSVNLAPTRARPQAPNPTTGMTTREWYNHLPIPEDGHSVINKPFTISVEGGMEMGDYTAYMVAGQDFFLPMRVDNMDYPNTRFRGTAPTIYTEDMLAKNRWEEYQSQCDRRESVLTLPPQVRVTEEMGIRLGMEDSEILFQFLRTCHVGQVFPPVDYRLLSYESEGVFLQVVPQEALGQSTMARVPIAPNVTLSVITAIRIPTPTDIFLNSTRGNSVYKLSFDDAHGDAIYMDCHGAVAESVAMFDKRPMRASSTIFFINDNMNQSSRPNVRVGPTDFTVRTNKHHTIPMNSYIMSNYGDSYHRSPEFRYTSQLLAHTKPSCTPTRGMPTTPLSSKPNTTTAGTIAVTPQRIVDSGQRLERPVYHLDEMVIGREITVRELCERLVQWARDKRPGHVTSLEGIDCVLDEPFLVSGQRLNNSVKSVPVFKHSVSAEDLRLDGGSTINHYLNSINSIFMLQCSDYNRAAEMLHNGTTLSTESSPTRPISTATLWGDITRDNALKRLLDPIYLPTDLRGSGLQYEEVRARALYIFLREVLLATFGHKYDAYVQMKSAGTERMTGVSFSEASNFYQRVISHFLCLDNDARPTESNIYSLFRSLIGDPNLGDRFSREYKATLASMQLTLASTRVCKSYRNVGATLERLQQEDLMNAKLNVPNPASRSRLAMMGEYHEQEEPSDDYHFGLAGVETNMALKAGLRPGLNSTTRERSPIYCYLCGQPNHIIGMCPHAGKAQDGKRAIIDFKKVAALAPEAQKALYQSVQDRGALARMKRPEQESARQYITDTFVALLNTGVLPRTGAEANVLAALGEIRLTDITCDEATRADYENMSASWGM
jgi:hypothetical protein